MRWVNVSQENPKQDGFYFCWHARYGKIVCGFSKGSWGEDIHWPVYWLEEDGMPQDPPSCAAL